MRAHLSLRKILCSLIFIGILLLSYNYIFNSHKEAVNYTAVKSEEIVEKFFSLLKDGNLQEASLYLDNSKTQCNLVFSKKFEEKIIKDSFSRLEYTILSCKIRGETAEVKIKITSLDLLTIYNELASRHLEPLIDIYLNGSDEEKIQAKSKVKNIINTYINNELNKESYPKTTNEVKLTLKLENDKWVIKTNEELLYALSGRMPQLLRKK